MARKTSSETAIPVEKWLVLGSFPLAERTTGKWLTNGYACEADFAANAGESFDGRTWQACDREVLDFVDPALGFAQREWCFAYALTYIKSPRRQPVRLLVASDDGVSVWLNGALVHTIDCQRGLADRADAIPVTLKEGWNALLCKVAQGGGAWALRVRVAPASAKGRTPSVSFGRRRPAGKAFQGLQQRDHGIVLGSEPPRISLAPDGKASVFEVRVRLFNDSGSRATRVQAALLDSGGERHASASLAPLAPFEGRWVGVDLPGEALLAALAQDRRLDLHVSSSAGEMTIPLPEDIAVRIFLLLACGFEVPLNPDAVVDVPPVFRGQSATIEVYPENEDRLSREVHWPQLPRRQVLASETEKGKVRVGVSAPVGVPGLAARITFGDASMQELIARVRFVAHRLGADTVLAGDAARKGLAALVEGRTAEVRQALEELYDALARTQPNRKDHHVTLVGHAHIDMNWLWVTSETAQCCHDTFRQVLAFMEEFPEFTFSQSQASTYQYIERSDPEMFERIRARVEEGRWEVLGGCLTEGDTNLSSGEGFARQVLLGQRYFRSRFGKMSRVGWLPDNFGHVAQLPQILRLAGMDFFYAHRCQPQIGPYVWEGIDGTRVINYVTPTYNGEVVPDMRFWPEHYDPRHKKLIWVYGVGDHGGGPTRRDITRARAYNDMPGFPTIEFGTAEGFFRSLEPLAEDYAVHKGELQYVFEGCYTSIARIKEASRRCENALYGAELVSGLLALDGFPYPEDLIHEAWYWTVYNQFHDILCGSAIHDSNRESIGTYDHALSKAEEARYAALRRLAARAPTCDTCGQPLVVFNPQARQRTDVVEAEIFTHIPPPTARLRHWGNWVNMPFEPIDVGQGPYATIRLVDEQGKAVDAQIVDGKLFPNGYRIRVQFLAKDLPPCGHRVFYSRPDLPGEAPKSTPTVKGTTIESAHFRVEVDPKTGHLARVYDKKRKKEVLAKGAAANALRIDMEAPHGMSAWDLGPITESIRLDEAESVRVIETGPVRAVVEVKRSWRRSKFTQRIVVYRDLPRIDFELDARWFELGGPDVDSPTLRVSFPLEVDKGKFFCDTPFAAVERPTSGREVPAQRWIDLSGRGGGAALLNDSKFGHRCQDTTLETTLLRASYDPDLYPDQGPHLIRYSLFPHAGNWIQGRVAEEGIAFNTRPLAIETPPSADGDLPDGTSLLKLEPDNLYLSAVKKTEEGDGLIVRFYEGHGEPTEATLTFFKPAQSVSRVNLLEFEQRAVEPATGLHNVVHVPVRAHEIVSLRVEF